MKKGIGRRRGISSIYGFIMIFLLSMASIQVWSSAVGSLTAIQGASDESHQIEQMQGLEHISMSFSQGNITVTNNGQVPSVVEFMRLIGQNDSSTLTLNRQLSVGASFQVPIKLGYTAELVTALGNVFILTPPDPQLSGPTIEQASGGEANAELFQNPYEPSMFFVGSGSMVYAFDANGSAIWSFDAGWGFVTDVMPISGGDSYVSVGYGYSSNSAILYELGPNGNVLASYSVRLDQDVPGSSTGSFTTAVSKGEDSQYAYYDGWFYSSGGSTPGVPSDDFPLVSADSSDFYFYTALGIPSVNGSCSGGDEVKLYDYVASSLNPSIMVQSWIDYFHLGACDVYPPQLLGATAARGLLAAAFSEPPYVTSGESPSGGQNPYLIVTTDTGHVLYDQPLPENGYSSSMATDGSNVYLALPAADEVQVVGPSEQTIETFNVGFPASQLLWAYGSLFAISNNQVRVYGSGMSLDKIISFVPLTISSYSNGFLSESSLQNASFLPINSTSYVALLENSTGYTSMVVGTYD